MKSIFRFLNLLFSALPEFSSKEKNLSKLYRNGAILLDVRTRQEYEIDHVPDSRNIPLHELEERHAELDRDAAYITVCSHGIRSKKGVQVLKKNGFKNIYDGGPLSSLRHQLQSDRVKTS